MGNLGLKKADDIYIGLILMAHLMIHFPFLNFKTIFFYLIVSSVLGILLGFLGHYFQLRDAL